jgi:hypothetical protein
MAAQLVASRAVLGSTELVSQLVIGSATLEILSNIFVQLSGNPYHLHKIKLTGHKMRL